MNNFSIYSRYWKLFFKKVVVFHVVFINIHLFSFGNPDSFSLAPKHYFEQKTISLNLLDSRIPVSASIDLSDNFLENGEFVIQLGDVSIKGVSEISSINEVLQVFHDNTKDVTVLGVKISNPEINSRLKRELASRLWLKFDIEPFLYESFDEMQRHVSSEKHQLVDPLTLEVRVKEGLLTIDDYQEWYKEFVDNSNFDQEDLSKLKKMAEKYIGKKISFISSTPQGGGVALMRHALIRLLRLLGVDIHWFVLEPDPIIFLGTKAWHNASQGKYVSDDRDFFIEVEKLIEDNPEKAFEYRAFLDEMREFLSNSTERTGGINKYTNSNSPWVKRYREWSRRNMDKLAPNIFGKKEGSLEIIPSTDYLVIDDPQPSGIQELIQNQKYESDLKILFRYHIQLMKDQIAKEGTPQKKVFDSVFDRIKDADLFLFHPILDFIPDTIQKDQVFRDKTVLAGATTDPLDGLGKILSEEQAFSWIQKFNRYMDTLPQDQVMGRVDFTRTKKPFLQIARFDPSKGIDLLVEGYVNYVVALRKSKVKDQDIPQLEIVGHGAIDDPDGGRILKNTLDQIKKSLEKYPDLVKKEDFVVCRIPHRIKVYEEVNEQGQVSLEYFQDTDQILNSLITLCHSGGQMSTKEGFEVKVSEFLMHGKPMIVNMQGGIPLQVETKDNGKINAFGVRIDSLEDEDEIRKLTEYIRLLYEDEDFYLKLKVNAKTGVKNNFTVFNALRWFAAFEATQDTDYNGDLRELNHDELNRIFFKKVVAASKPSTEFVLVGKAA